MTLRPHCKRSTAPFRRLGIHLNRAPMSANIVSLTLWGLPNSCGNLSDRSHHEKHSSGNDALPICPWCEAIRTAPRGARNFEIEGGSNDCSHLCPSRCDRLRGLAQVYDAFDAKR